MLIVRHINFLLIVVVHLIVMIQISQTRPSLDPERVLNKLSKRSLLQTYKIDVQDIVFPDSEEDDENDFIEPIHQIKEVPYCATSGNTFCEDIDNYPYNRIQLLLKKNNTFNNLFGVDASPEEIANRVDLNDEKFICEANHRLIFPKIGKTKDNTWQYIVNQDNSPEGYIQGIRIETCKYLGEPCELVNSIPTGYITSCKQKYMYRRLLSITDKGTTINDFFELPSACCCSYKRDINFLRRFGSPVASTKKNY